jgi:RNA recognition motif-containing protein
VGGLPPAMGSGKQSDVYGITINPDLLRLNLIFSDELKELFEGRFGPVSEAAVMGNQSGGRIQSRGFGFVTFKNQSSCVEAVRQHFITLFGKRVRS